MLISLLACTALIHPLLPLKPASMPALQIARSEVQTTTTVPLYGKLEIPVSVPIGDGNPFDPGEIDVYAQFTRDYGRGVVGPFVVRVNGFLDQPFARKLAGKTETWTPTGKPQWRVRFAPPRTGPWTYKIYARVHADKTQTADKTKELGSGQFQVTAQQGSGFVRRSARNASYFEFTSGKPYFPVGENMGWAGSRGTFDYEDWLTALGKAGGNWIRVWMTEGKCGIEWSGTRKKEAKGLESYAGYGGLGIYNLAEAARLDRILDLAERNGIYVMLCFGTYGELKTGGFFNEGAWDRNPYNKANGGPCAKPEDFWTDPTARKMYQQRLRYILARYGHRANIFAWEFWNEALAPTAWVAEMAQYVKGTGAFSGQPADPYRHLLSTTYGNPDVWKLPEMDFTMTHDYGTGNIPDYAPVIYADAQRHAVYGKPHLMAEFGIDWRTPDTKYDPQGLGVNLHNGLWSGLASGDAGTGMIWWWDNYVAPQNVYAPFVAVRKFADAVPWTSGTWKAIAFDPPLSRRLPNTRTDLVAATDGAWGKADKTTYTIPQNGKPPEGPLPTFLYSPSKPELRTTPTFQVDFSQAGEFGIHISAVSDSATLRILLDDKLAREIKLSAAPAAQGETPEYVSTKRVPEYNLYQATWDKTYRIPVPSGKHAIRLEVTAGDWARVDSFLLTHYRSSRLVDVNAYGLSNGTQLLLWVQNAAHTWKNIYDKKPIPTLADVEITLRDAPSTVRTVEWWDTKTGQVIKREKVVVTNGRLTLLIPTLAEDIAVLAR